MAHNKLANVRVLNGRLHAACRRRDIATVGSLMKMGKAMNALDGRSYAVAVNACADVGDVTGALNWLWEAARLGTRFAPNVEACSAACKALCSEGDLSKGRLLMCAMAASGSKGRSKVEVAQEREAIRRFWAACGLGGDFLLGGEAKPNVRTINAFLRGCLRTGGVEAATWCYSQMARWGIEADSSSRTYVTTVLCCALRPRDAVTFVGEAALQDPQACTVMARAHAVVGEGEACAERARAGLSALALSQNGIQGDESHEACAATGGRRPWSTKPSGDKRIASNEMFRSHRAAEQRAELEALVLLGERRAKGEIAAPDAVEALRRCLALQSPADTADSLVEMARLKFGLEEALRRVAERAFPERSRSSRKRRTLSTRAGLAAVGAELADAKRGITFDHRAWLRTSPTRRLALEVGAGDGEWAARRASTPPSNMWAWVACECRHDRAAAMVARVALASIENLGVVHADAATCLETFADDALDACYANFPQPPTQVSATDKPASAYDGHHMLDSPFFTLLGRVLKPRGAVCIVTDNAWYARLLVRVAKHVDPCDEVFRTPIAHGYATLDAHGRKIVYQGNLSRLVGHFEDSSATYFDRLWRTGISRHASKTDRFVLYLRKASESSCQSNGNVSILSMRRKRRRADRNLDFQSREDRRQRCKRK